MTFFARINSMTPQQALLAYLERGKSVFPVRPDKRPRVPWKIYQTACATPYEAKQWINRWPDMALGFPTGEYNGYNVLDADTPEAEEWLLANAPATPLMQRTRRGTHRFYRCGSLKIPTVKGLGPGGIDSRGAGGYVVIAPSTIAGHRYAWECGPVAKPIPTLDALGEAFFAASGTSPAPGGILRPHGHANASNGASTQAQRYDDAGRMYDGREDHITRVTMGMISTFLRERGYLPEAENVASEMWGICQKVMDLSDGKYSYAFCFKKARYAIEGVRTARILVYPDVQEDEQGFGKW